MRKFSVFSIILLGAVLQDSRAFPKNDIVQYRFDRKQDGYHFEYVSGDGSKRSETGTFEWYPNREEPILKVKGFFSYLGSDGKEFLINYEADENGTKTKGDIIPPLHMKVNRISPVLIKTLSGGGLG